MFDSNLEFNEDPVYWFDYKNKNFLDREYQVDNYIITDEVIILMSDDNFYTSPIMFHRSNDIEVLLINPILNKVEIVKYLKNTLRENVWMEDEDFGYEKVITNKIKEIEDLIFSIPELKQEYLSQKL